MAQARMNRRQTNKARAGDRDGFIAPPIGGSYLGKPIHKSDTAAIRVMLKGLSDADPDLGELERQDQYDNIDRYTPEQLEQILAANGFSLCKRKELHVERVKTVQTSAGVSFRSPDDEGAAGEIQYITSFTG